MPKRGPGWVPRLYHVRARGIGRARFPGEPDRYFGQSGDWPASQKSPPAHILAAYQSACASWLERQARGDPAPAPGRRGDRPLAALVPDYLAMVGRRSAQSPSRGRYPTVRTALSHALAKLGARTPATLQAADFEAVRDEILARGVKGPTARDYCKVIRQFLRWAGVPREVRNEIADLPSPPGGWGEQSEPVEPVTEAHLATILPHCSPRLAAMLQLQRLTGMRPGEVCGLALGEIDREAAPGLWLYRPRRHKKRRLGRERRIWLGPQAQAILTPWLEGKGDDEVIFPSRGGAAYRRGYGRAIHTACDRAGVPRFRPNQIRHTTATALELDDPHGLTAAQAVLGHDSPAMTRRYSSALDQLAQEAMRRFG